jgi:uncharacterized protein
MLAGYFAAIVDFCVRRAPLIIAVAAILGLGSAAYVERHFAVNGDVHKLLSPNLPWVNATPPIWRPFRSRPPRYLRW